MTRNWRDLANASEYEFPDVSTIDYALGDLITVGADLSPETLIYAYSRSYFPMPVDVDNKNEIGWFSPVNRGVIPLHGLKVSRSLRKSMKKYECRINTCFRGVIELCKTQPRHGAWITDDFVEAYVRLHDLGFAHSVEVLSGNECVGGLYGVGFGHFFAGESMVSTATDASKVALVHLVEHLTAQGVTLLDTQWKTDHLARLGAQELERNEYLERLKDSLA